MQIDLNIVEGLECCQKKCGNTPVLKGTRVPLSRILAEIADGSSLGEIADDMDLDLGQLKTVFNSLAINANPSLKVTAHD